MLLAILDLFHIIASSFQEQISLFAPRKSKNFYSLTLETARKRLPMMRNSYNKGFHDLL